jgi:hypothetical protein
MPRLTAPVVPAGALSQAAQPTLRAGDLLLRPWAAGDAAVLHADRWHDMHLHARIQGDA